MLAFRVLYNVLKTGVCVLSLLFWTPLTELFASVIMGSAAALFKGRVYRELHYPEGLIIERRGPDSLRWILQREEAQHHARVPEYQPTLNRGRERDRRWTETWWTWVDRDSAPQPRERSRSRERPWSSIGWTTSTFCVLGWLESSPSGHPASMVDALLQVFLWSVDEELIFRTSKLLLLQGFWSFQWGNAFVYVCFI